ncbi:MAG: multicopper oxidase domain-containing protein, partial [Ignavibacteriaceae bacterium]|nr:multicopper oxidase domain-containing protein [Ignavibacteriaceae bacterium]
MFSNLFLRKIPFGIIFISLLISFQQTSYSQLLNPNSQTKFVNPLPVIKDLGLRVDATSSKNYNAQMVQITQDLGLQGITGYTGTTVWAYQFDGLPATYPGATIVAQRDKKVKIKWENNLPGHFLPVDASLHMAHDPIPADKIELADKINWIRDWYAAGNVPAVTHLHGGHTESGSDGLPEAWFTQGFKTMGKYWEKKRYKYDNDQEAATLWYHDHALGITRLNVYMGLAGFYLLRDDNENNLINTNVLPGGDYEIEIVIQDRDFTADGQLFWPANPTDAPNTIWNPYEEFIDYDDPEAPVENPLFNTVFPTGGPTALAEFFGDFILVNGKPWPKLDVEPRKYRFRFLNGSDSRFYVLEFRDDEFNGTAQTFMQIGSDDGLLEQPVSLDQFVIAPGERMDMVVDFTGLENTQIYLRNFGPDSPFGGLPIDPEDVADPNTTGQIMMFEVSKPLSAIANATVDDETPLNTITPLGAVNETRQLALFEGTDEYGRLQPLLGGVMGGNIVESLTWDDAITENPALNDVETWEVYNFTGDAHPVHLHLVAFQIIDREEILEFTSTPKDQLQHSGKYGQGSSVDLSSVMLSGVKESPPDNEKGWKDTFIVPPGYVGRVKARFDRPGRYVWHCHILSHEDHEMMRPYHVGALPKQTAENEIASVTDFRLEQNYPNPFNPSTVINFSVPNENTLVTLKVYNSLGQEVGTLINQIVPAG